MLEEIKKRKSIRQYTDEPVTHEELEDLLRAAMLAPSACDIQNWKFIATNKRQDLIDIANLPGYYKMAQHAGAAIIAMGDPTVEFGQFYQVNVAAAIENLLLEATHNHLGAVWCAIDPMKDRIEAFRKLFNIEEKYIPVACIVIGHTNDNTEKKDQYDESKVIWR